MLHHLYSTESVEHLTVSLVIEQKEKRQLNVIVHKLGKSFANDRSSRKNDDIMRLYLWILKELLIKTHGSESRGQEEAACTRVFWPTRPLQ